MPESLPHLLLTVLVVLLLPPLLPGVINRTKAAFAGRQGPPLFQAYRELQRLWHKGSVFSQTTTVVFRLAPLVSLTALLLAALFLPLSGHVALVSFDGDLFALIALLALGRFAMTLAALDTGSPFAGMGAAREVTFGALAEPSLLVGLLIVSRLTGHFALGPMLSTDLSQHWTRVGAAPLALVAISWFIVLLAENSRLPFDDPTTHLELTMVHEAMVLDTSGPLLAIVQYAASLKLFLFAVLLQRVVLPPSPLGPWLDWLATLATLLLIAVLIGVAESVLARLRLVSVPKMLVAALLASIFGVLLLARG